MKPVLLKIFICTIALSLMSVPAVWAKETKSLPEVSEDGLHLLKDTKARVVYAKPGASLEPYSKVMLVD